MAVVQASVAGRDVRVWALTIRPREIGHWREAVADLLRDWRAREEVIALGEHGVSELLANVLRHVDDPRCSLRVSRTRRDLLVEVLDRSCRPPRVGLRPHWSAECGRGLWLLREMVDDLGYMPTPYPAGEWPSLGKTVWFLCRSVLPEEPN
ncbi:ATP-binding protein [Streptomyces sedi]|uniref:ATP-binding protein n=1 Tax=Streptomyces sedi TaxID=555059 RepID=A0A5C4UR86_9ACTN|nr:ATP-binding protein [Streptomyces sedi]TNM25793.1 ATP-binding protein [Streptomyces sedi]